jgi:IS605 OrfB family transposase
MRTTVSVKIKINHSKQIFSTIKAYTKVLQFCVDMAWKKDIKNNIKLHPFVYKTIRKTLPSQLAISCIKQACGIVKKAKTKPLIKKASVRYNFPRSANLKGDILVLRLLKVRQEFKINIPVCFKDYFSWELSESILKVDRKGRCFFVFIFSKEVNAIEQNSRSQNIVLGIDLGVNNLAVTSDGKFFNSGVVKQAKRKFRYLRSKLQAKGTHSSKRLLKKISGRETRFMAWINHNISKNIVTNFNGGKIVMENLKGIRKKNRGKRMNYWISNWSFYQLQSFIEYKAIRKGIGFIKVKPNYTSQICSRCGKLGSRSSANFVCSHCGFFLNADLNAGRNLAHPMLGERQATINLPHSRIYDAEGVSQYATEAELMAKAPHS